MAVRRKVREAPVGQQLRLFVGDEKANPGASASRERPLFRMGHKESLYFGGLLVQTYLKEHAQLLPFVVEDVLESCDLSSLERAYSTKGRPPYHPKLMLGMILYALIRGQATLRDMELLARLDLGMMYLGGGISPDHSSFGRFIARHLECLNEGLVEMLVSAVIQKSGSGLGTLSGDGTIIESCASQYGLLRKEAAAARSKQKATEAAYSRDSKPKKKQAELAKLAADILDKRVASRRAQGKDPSTLRIAPSDPEASVQKTKSKTTRPSYKASILANECRFIVSYAVDPTSETSVVGGMLDQANRVGLALYGDTENVADTLLLDGGYLCETVLERAIQDDVNVLIPPRGTTQNCAGSKYSKDKFKFEEDDDVYICPMGVRLISTGGWTGEEQPRKAYSSKECRECPVVGDCTKSKTRQRRVRRYKVDELKEALKEVMENPRARKAYSMRKAVVEPVFSVFRGPMKFTRFLRRGLKNVAGEFGLRALAYNIRNLVRYARFVAKAAGLPGSIRSPYPTFPGRDGSRVVLAQLTLTVLMEDGVVFASMGRPLARG